MEFKCMWNTEPVSECPPVKELNRLRADVKRLETENRMLEEENRQLRERMGEEGAPLSPAEPDSSPGGGAGPMRASAPTEAPRGEETI